MNMKCTYMCIYVYVYIYIYVYVYTLRRCGKLEELTNELK